MAANAARSLRAVNDFHFEMFEPPAEATALLRGSFYARGRIGYQTEKIIPTGQIAVLFNLGNPHRLGKAENPADNPAFERGWIDGFQTTPTWHTPTDGTHVLGLLFEPIGFHAVTGIDMAAFADRTHALETALPAEFIEFVQGQLDAAGDASTHRAIAGMLANLERRELPDWLWAFYADVVEQRGDVDIDSWYGRAGCSERHASKLFKRAVGVTPKVLCRIHRLLALLEALDPTRDVNWTSLAHDFGFYDQPHFNREFRLLTGLYPSEYLTQRRREYPDMVQGDNVVFAPQD